jgi:hypothetical protein
VRVVSHVAGKAAGAIVGISLGRVRLRMGVMARDASKCCLAPLEAATGIHLLDLAHESIVKAMPRPKIDVNSLMQRRTRAIIREPAARAENSHLRLEMALLANALAKVRFQVGGVDDVGLSTLAGQGLSRVVLTRTVTPFAADRMPAEDWGAIVVLRALDEVGLVCVAENAARAYRPLEVRVVFFESRGEVPAPFKGIPGDRRGEEEAIPALDQKGNALLARTDGVLDDAFVLDNDVMLGILHRLAVNHPAVLHLDLEPDPSFLERSLIPKLSGARRGEGFYRCYRLAHRVVGEALGDRLVTACASQVTHVTSGVLGRRSATFGMG